MGIDAKYECISSSGLLIVNIQLLRVCGGVTRFTNCMDSLMLGKLNELLFV